MDIEQGNQLSGPVIAGPGPGICRCLVVRPHSFIVILREYILAFTLTTSTRTIYTVLASESTAVVVIMDQQ